MRKYKIYPKQFRSEKIAIEKNRCFFIMPFSEEFDSIYGNIKSSLQKEGYICYRADEISNTTAIMNTILHEMLKAQFVIADLSHPNPNVFYELGIAHTFKDMENIIILKQEDSKVPFDVKHIQHIEYNPNNYLFLTSKLKEILANSKYISNFYDVLNKCGVIDYVHDNLDEFVEILKDVLSEEITVVTEILNGECELKSSEIEKVSQGIQYHIRDMIKKYDSTILTGIVNFYFELLVACNKYYFIHETLQFMLYDFFSTCVLSEKDCLSYQTDLALKFVAKGKQLNLFMPWIVDYFTRSKSGSIDLNRYKLESFLMKTTNHEVNEIICNAILHDNSHIREHFADIIGEKKLIEANDLLCTQLLKEKNYFTATSFIDALRKLGKNTSCETIKVWFEKNEDELIITKQSFVFDHIKLAYAALDASYSHTFNSQYSQYFRGVL